MSIRTGRDSSPTWRIVSPDQYERELGIAPVFLRALLLRIGRASERLLRGQKVLKILKFVTTSFPMACLFAIIEETRRVWFSFRHLHLLELKIKNFRSFHCVSVG